VSPLIMIDIVLVVTSISCVWLILRASTATEALFALLTGVAIAVWALLMSFHQGPDGFSLPRLILFPVLGFACGFILAKLSERWLR
jgi:hypothetical protein